MAHWKDGAEFFPMSRETIRASRREAAGMRKHVVKDHAATERRHDRMVQANSVPTAIYHKTVADADGDSSEWRTGGARTKWWDEVCAGLRYCEWVPASVDTGHRAGVFIGGLIGARGVA